MISVYFPPGWEWVRIHHWMKTRGLKGATGHWKGVFIGNRMQSAWHRNDN